MMNTTDRSVQQSLAQTFGFKTSGDTEHPQYCPANFGVNAFAFNDQLPIPKADPNYVFNKDVVRDVMCYLDMPMTNGFRLFGHYGTGKTSHILQIANRLNYPLIAVEGNEQYSPEDAAGKTDLIDGNTVFTSGALTHCIENGYIFLINEIDRIPSSRLAAWHSILDGNPLILDQDSGRRVDRHPSFRMIATANSAGSGDQLAGGGYDVNRLDLAFNDRWIDSEVVYLLPEVEQQLVKTAQPKLPDEIIKDMVVLANETRRKFNNAEPGSDDKLNVMLSTRGMLRWASMLVYFAGAPNRLSYTLERALSMKAAPAERLALDQLGADIFGTTWKKEKQS